MTINRLGPSHAAVAALAAAQPELRAKNVQNGAVEITFVKGDSTGVEIRSKRGSETAFSFLARDTESPCVDTRHEPRPRPRDPPVSGAVPRRRRPRRPAERCAAGHGTREAAYGTWPPVSRYP
ncbi:MAG: hypothetical protein ABR915_02410 [Thermoguttaceae bacterium]